MNLEVQESPERTIARLERELQHVNGQMQLEHQGLLEWRQRALQAERDLDKLQRKHDKLQRKHAQPSARTIKPMDPADQLLSWEMESVDDAETELQV